MKRCERGSEGSKCSYEALVNGLLVILMVSMLWNAIFYCWWRDAKEGGHEWDLPKQEARDTHE
jgi:hypothetical protein